MDQTKITFTPEYIETMTREQMIDVILKTAQSEAEKIVNALSDNDLRKAIKELFEK